MQQNMANPQTWPFGANANGQVGHSQPQNQAPQGQNNIQPSPSNMHAQVQQGNHLLQPGMVARPPSGQQHPHQQPHPNQGGSAGAAPGHPFPTQVSPNMNPQYPFSANNANGNPTPSPSMGPPGIQSAPSGTMQLPPPLEKSRFDSAYKSYSMRKNVKHEMRLMNVEGHDIDLYALHMNVMQEGGFNKVCPVENASLPRNLNFSRCKPTTYGTLLAGGWVSSSSLGLTPNQPNLDLGLLSALRKFIRSIFMVSTPSTSVP